MWLIIVAIALAVLLYLKVVHPHKYWKKKGISYINPLPLFGNMGSTVFRTRAMANMIEDLYNACPGKRYVGVYQFLRPTLLLRDLELIKKITIREFATFPDHLSFTADQDILWNKNLFAIHNKDGWQDVRSTLSPAFTSSKMRAMFTLMQDCAQQFADYFKNQGETVKVELKDAFTRFTNDVIGSTAFGVTCNSLKDRENEFYLMGKDATNFSGLRSLKFFGYSVSPTMMKLLKVNVFPEKVSTFFRRLVKETLRIRQENNVIRPDLMHLLMEARRGRLQHENQSNVVDSGFAVVEESEVGKMQKRNNLMLSDDFITAQALIFFLGGFDTASTLMCFTAYELAINPDIQRKLYKEVDATVKACKGSVSYEALLSMKYLDNVISESLRKWPPFIFTDRESAQPYTIEPEQPGEKPLHLEAGSVCWVPIYGIHRDPDYYPNPDKFHPDRFNDDNKHTINPSAYLPFGAGPRSCLGSRLALLKSKLIFVEILRNFEIVPIKETPIPLSLQKSQFSPMAVGGFWVGLKPRYDSL